LTGFIYLADAKRERLFCIVHWGGRCERDKFDKRSGGEGGKRNTKSHRAKSGRKIHPYSAQTAFISSRFIRKSLYTLYAAASLFRLIKSHDRWQLAASGVPQDRLTREKYFPRADGGADGDTNARSRLNASNDASRREYIFSATRRGALGQFPEYIVR